MYIASFKTMTHAIKGKNSLLKNKIEAEIIKVDPSFTDKGCAYGVQFNHYNWTYIYEIFNQNKVKYIQVKKV